MAGARGSVPRPRVTPAVVLLALAALVGVALVAIGLRGAFEPPSTPAASQLPSPTARATRPPSPTGSVAPGATSGPGPAQPTPPATPPATGDPLLEGLLAEGDLPGLASPSGPEEGTRYDIDESAFEANDGIRVVSRTWQSLADTGLAAVFDFRMQFPTDEAARAYLDAAEPVLSEGAATGQRPIPSPPAIGADTRVFGLETSGPNGTVLLRTYLFRVGPVVAKLVAGGTGVDAATTDALAATAAARIVAAGPPAPGSPRPPATPSRSPSRTPAATEPMPTGEALAALLLEHVPPDIGGSCVPDAQRLWPGELATLVCSPAGSGVTVTYSGFGSADTLEAAFDASLETIDLGEVADSCDQGPYLGGYEVEDEEVGRVACWAEQGGQAIMWSDDRLAILGVAASPTLDAAGLYLWWLGAGPVP